MLGRRVGNPATGARDGDTPSWGQEEQQGWEQEGAPATYGAVEQEGLGAGLAYGYNAPAYDNGEAPTDSSEQYMAVDASQIAPSSYQERDLYGDEPEDAYEANNTAEDDADYDAWDDESAYGEADQEEVSRALVPAGERLPAPGGIRAVLSRLSGEPGHLAMLQARVTGAMLVPGHNRPKRPGALGQSIFSPRAYRPRPFIMQIAIILLAVTAMATTAFAMAPINTESQLLTGFTSLGGLAEPASATQAPYHWYVVHYGDTLDSIASQFRVLAGGILEMNGLHTADDLYVGLHLKIPYSSTYGSDFQSVVDIPIPPPDKEGNRYGTSPWNSVAGATDDANVCAPAGNSDNQADRLAFQLGSPNLGASFARGFTWYHNGVDLDNPPGSPILAAQAGLVLFAGWDVGGLGWSVKLNHCNGLSTIYGHMMYPPLVHAGDYVQLGEQVGQEGSTGNSTGPHLHFMTEWWNQAANPYCFEANLPAGNTPCTDP